MISTFIYLNNLSYCDIIALARVFSVCRAEHIRGLIENLVIAYIMSGKIILDRLEIECLIGIFDWEREIKQKVLISFELYCDTGPAAMADNIDLAVDYKAVSKAIISLVEPSRFFLIETMAEKIAEICLGFRGVNKAIVTVAKPGAIRGSKNISVQIERPDKAHIIFFGVGGNIDPELNIPAGLDLIRSRFEVVNISCFYRSEAWGAASDQPDYINLAIKARTDKDLFGARAEALLIEKMAGRRRTDDKFSPRSLDIDLLVYDSVTQTKYGWLLPHPQLLTQQFVYLPMLDIAPELVVPGIGEKLKNIAPKYDNPGLRIDNIGMAL